MQTAILVYEEMTVLDAIGPYDVFRSVPGWEVRFVGKERGEVRDEAGTLGINADHSLERGRPTPTSSSSPAAPGAGR